MLEIHPALIGQQPRTIPAQNSKGPSLVAALSCGFYVQDCVTSAPGNAGYNSALILVQTVLSKCDRSGRRAGARDWLKTHCQFLHCFIHIWLGSCYPLEFFLLIFKEDKLSLRISTSIVNQPNDSLIEQQLNGMKHCSVSDLLCELYSNTPTPFSALILAYRAWQCWLLYKIQVGGSTATHYFCHSLC